jgi:hypothetical protein
VKPFEDAFHKFIEEQYPDVLHEIEKTKDLPDAIAKRLDQAAATCKQKLAPATPAAPVAAAA